MTTKYFHSITAKTLRKDKTKKSLFIYLFIYLFIDDNGGVEFRV
jgi:hypothetical protein